MDNGFDPHEIDMNASYLNFFFFEKILIRAILMKSLTLFRAILKKQYILFRAN